MGVCCVGVALAERGGMNRVGSLQASAFGVSVAESTESDGDLALLDTWFRNAPIGLAFLDRELRFRRINAVLAEINGLSPEAHLGKRVSELLPGLPAEYMEARFREVLRTRVPALDVDLCGETPASPGKARHWKVDYYPVERNGEPIGIGALVREVTAERETQAALRESEARQLRQAREALDRSNARFTRLWESGVICMCVADLEGNVFDANDAYLEMLGFTRDDLRLGLVRWSNDPPESAEQSRRAVRQLEQHGIIGQWEKVKSRKDGSHVPVLIGVARLDEDRCITYMTDLTDRKRAETALEQLRRAQKMEAIASLAGGVAHDFNNILSVILSYTQAMMNDLSQGDPMRDDLREIGAAAARGAALTRQLLLFSRHQALDPRVLDLNEIVRGMEKMIHRIVGEDVEVELRNAPSLGMVRADPGHLEQVLMNLVVNARDAMPGGGRLTIETADVVLDEEWARQNLAQPGAHVMLKVTDTGTGIPPEIQSQIFEPFFTTKGGGKGTGLGLSTVFGIVRQRGGAIAVASEPGRGATFRVYLPRAEGPIDRLPLAAAAPLTLDGDEAILLVEDDPQVR